MGIDGPLEQSTSDLVADVLARRKEEIVQRWLVLVAADAHRDDVQQTDLRDGIDEYLERLADALRHQDTAARRGAAAWADVARKHALTRVRIGFDISQLVHEFILLRSTIFDALRDEVLQRDPRQAERIADLVEGAIATAVTSYVESRDFEQRRREAEHIAFITHELRNPLNVAVLAMSKLQRMLGTGVEREVDLIVRSHRRLRDLIDKVLENERLELGEIEVKPVDITLGEIMDVAARGARLVAAEKGVQLEIELDANVVVHADPELLTSAVQNLIDNAVKFTDHGRVRVSTVVSPADVIINVFDNCEGLSAEELRTIFQPFKRGHSNKPGNGLGLAIARRAIEAHGGTLAADSQPGRGCHFWLTLPRGKTH